jgi:hypothetical protein
VGVNVSQLHGADAAAGLGQRLGAALPSPGPDGRLRAAELLTLDPAPLALGVMP